MGILLGRKKIDIAWIRITLLSPSWRLTLGIRGLPNLSTKWILRKSDPLFRKGRNASTTGKCPRDPSKDNTTRVEFDCLALIVLPFRECQRECNGFRYKPWSILHIDYNVPMFTLPMLFSIRKTWTLRRYAVNISRFDSRLPLCWQFASVYTKISWAWTSLDKANRPMKRTKNPLTAFTSILYVFMTHEASHCLWIFHAFTFFYLSLYFSFFFFFFSNLVSIEKGTIFAKP